MKLPSYNNNDNDNVINHKSTIKNGKIETNNIDDIRVIVIRKLIRALIKNNNDIRQLYEYQYRNDGKKDGSSIVIDDKKKDEDDNI